MRERVGRIDQIVGGFRDAVLADQRLRQALRIADIVEAEAALHAQPVLVGRAVAAGDVKQLVVLDLVGELAADAAIGADAVHLAVGEFGAHVLVVDQRRRHQRAGRAGLHAFAAGDAGRVAHRVVEVEHDLLAVAAAGHADDVVDLHFAAGAHAEIALDAGVEIDRHGRMAAVGRGRVRACRSGWWRRPCGRPRPRISIADRARRLARRAGRKSAARTPSARAVLARSEAAFTFMPARGLADAARRQHALALDLDHAGAAIAVGAVAGLGRIAQMRDVGAEALGHLPDGLALERLDFAGRRG